LWIGFDNEKFLSVARVNGDVCPFFGSWFDIPGKSCTGYFLGYEVIAELPCERSLHEIALFKDAGKVCKPIIEGMANTRAW
jgi:hypothetical protein